MSILEINYTDFIISIESKNINGKVQKSEAKYKDDFKCRYIFSYPVSLFSLKIDSYNIREPNLTEIQMIPVFFENTNYFITIDFKSNGNENGNSVVNANISSPLKYISDQFFFNKNKQYLVGNINFSNNIGKFDLVINYNFKNTNKKTFIFSFEVFSTKINHKKDIKTIIGDIKNEYANLIFSFLRITHSNFFPTRKEKEEYQPEEVWLSLFENMYNKLLKYSKFIINKPRYKMSKKDSYITIEKIKKLTYAVEEEYFNNKYNLNRKYKVENHFLNIDTLENRFFKHVLKTSHNKYQKIIKYIIKNYEITNEFEYKLKEKEKDLRKILNHNFFNSIGQFRGFKQESLILQKALGYNKIYKIWIILNKTYTLFESIYTVYTKNIAELYQIWTFLRLKQMIQTILKELHCKEIRIRIDPLNINDKFNNSIKIKTNITTEKLNIDLFHELEFNNKSEAIKHLKIFTVKQRPDILLRIKRKDLKDSYDFTYIFDAKYRIDILDSKEYPPEDAINQMHRYRDAIYYATNNKRIGKEVIGAYILFPSIANSEDIEKSYYYKSIKQVNIGAFPLTPNNQNCNLLKNHIKRLIEKILKQESEILSNDIIPQKNMEYKPTNPLVLIGIIPSSEHEKCLENGFYFTGEKKPAIPNFEYFAPYIKGKGIKEYFKIKGYEIKERNKICTNNKKLYKPNDSSKRLIIMLGEKREIDNGKYFKIESKPIRIYRYAYLKNIKNPRITMENGNIEEKIKVLKK